MRPDRRQYWLFGGLLLAALFVIWPAAADLLYERQAGSVRLAFAAAEETVPEAYAEEKQRCEAYNAALWTESRDRGGSFRPGVTVRPDYADRLRLNRDGSMAYICIPSISLELPVYPGTDEETLARGAGHLPESSLPVGGPSTHAVITGHSGVSSRRLFTDLRDLEIGDCFQLLVLGESLNYEIREILTVLPWETDALEICEGQDLCTLVTCTPYGINSHRLLVRGERKEPGENDAGEKAAAVSPETSAQQEIPEASRNAAGGAGLAEGAAGHTPSFWTKQYLRSLLIGALIGGGMAAAGCIIRKRYEK